MTDAPLTADQNRSNARLAVMLAALVVCMIGAAYAAVPLYELFCRVTGFGGTTQVASDNFKGVIDRQMTVRFDSNVDPTLAWRVAPAKPVTDRIGTIETVNYTATNLSDRPITGQAIFNVTPEQAGIYFNKIECFCFTEQTLQPGETIDMPVTFFVDPDIAQNGDLDTIRNITLSYTFYRQDSEDS